MARNERHTMAEQTVNGSVDPQIGGRQQRGQLGHAVRPPYGQGRVVACVPVRRQQVAHEPGTDPRRTAAHEIIDHDPKPRDAAHLGEEGARGPRIKMVDDKGRVDDIERPVRVGQRKAVAELEYQFPGRDRPRVCDGRRRKDLRPAVDAGHRHVPASGSAPFDERERDVRPAGPDIEYGDGCPARGEGPDPGGGQVDATQPAVDPGKVTQVAGQRAGVVQRTIQQLVDVGQSSHKRQA